MDILDVVEKMVDRLRWRVDGMIARAVISRVNDALKTQRVQITILKGEVEDNVEHVQPLGLSFTPPADAEVLALAVAGDRAHTVAICASAPGSRPTGNSEAETGGLYSKAEWRVFIDKDGVVHLGAQSGEAPVARADLVDAELARIWDLLTGWSVAPQDGGLALQTKAIVDAKLVETTAAEKVKAT